MIWTVQTWHGAANSLAAADSLFIRKWAAKYAQQACSKVWEDDNLCQSFMEFGFVNWAESWSKRDNATQWCQNYSACPKTQRAPFFAETKVDNCSACKDFFGDYIMLAKNYENIFHEIFVQYGKDTCHGVYQEAACIWTMNDPRIEKIVREEWAALEGPEDFCQETNFCWDLSVTQLLTNNYKK